MALHDPFEPANLRSKGIEIPLGQSTIVYFTPSAREIDPSGKELDENQRNCRLNDENSDLDIFNKYTQEGCLFECKLKIAAAKCGCIPWSYPMLSVSYSFLDIKLFEFDILHFFRVKIIGIT